MTFILKAVSIFSRKNGTLFCSALTWYDGYVDKSDQVIGYEKAMMLQKAELGALFKQSPIRNSCDLHRSLY